MALTARAPSPDHGDALVRDTGRVRWLGHILADLVHRGVLGDQEHVRVDASPWVEGQWLGGGPAGGVVQRVVAAAAGEGKGVPDREVGRPHGERVVAEGPELLHRLLEHVAGLLGLSSVHDSLEAADHARGKGTEGNGSDGEGDDRLDQAEATVVTGVTEPAEHHATSRLADEDAVREQGVPARAETAMQLTRCSFWPDLLRTACIAATLRSLIGAANEDL